MKKTYLISILLILVLSSYCQSNSLFTEIQVDVNTLNAEQHIRYQKLIQSPAYLNLHFINIANLSQIDNDGVVYVNLPFLPSQNLYFQIESGKYTDETHYKWYGRINDGNHPFAMSSLTLMNLGNKFIGNITFDEHSFEIFDLTGGIRVICEKDLARQTSCAVDESVGQGQNPPMETLADPCIISKIRVLVLFTAAAEETQPDIESIAELSIFQVNTAFQNSQIYGSGTEVVLAGVEFLEGFTETPINIAHDINQLVIDPIANAFRSQYNADIVVLLTDGSYGGTNGFHGVVRANISYPNYDNAYAIVEVEDATTGRRTFAHEFGHLFGALHNDDPTSGFNHGYKFFTGLSKRFTLVAEIPKVTIYKKTRIEHYSNPNVLYLNEETGTTDCNNNARQIREQALTVANFFTESEPLVAEIITDKTSVNECNGGIANVSVSMFCGEPNYTYSWFRSTNNITWNLVSTNAFASISIASAPSNGGFKNTFYKVVVTDGTGATVTKYGSYHTYCDYDCPTCPKRLANTKINPITIYPNPTNGNGQIIIYQEKGGNLSIELLDIHGEFIQNIYKGYIDKGLNRVVLSNYLNLNTGIYLIRVNGQNINITEKIVINK